MARPELTDERKALIIAALFHDIGKFLYRAQKVHEGHERTGAAFVRDHLREFSALASIAERSASLVESHHERDTSSRLREADGLSASERLEQDVKIGRRPLESIFARIDIGVAPLPEGIYYFEPGPLRAESVFPSVSDSYPDEDLVMRWHAEAWDSFLQDLRRVPKDLEFGPLVHTLHALLEKWCARVSSAAYGSVPDIALFDHLRVSAAFADCLYLTDHPERPFLVIEGDLGGIQRFIYRLRIPHEEQKGSAKQLRGRSFYVRLIGETIASWFLDELGLFRPNLILSGGGHFLIIAPNREGSADLLRDLRRRANEWLLNQFHLDLNLVVEWVDCSRAEMEEFPEVLDRLGTRLARAKQRRASDLLASRNLFGPFEDEKAELKACTVCQALVTSDDPEITKCPVCELHQRIGAEMPRAAYLVEVTAREGSDKLHPVEGSVLIPFPEFGKAWYLTSKRVHAGRTSLEAVVGTVKDRLPSGWRARITTLGSSDFLDDETLRVVRIAGGGDVALDFAFQANFLPRKKDSDKGTEEVMSFEDIAKSREVFPYLGFLRADVDDLGYVFLRGFRSGTGDAQQDNRSLSRYAALSRELDLFFSAYVDRLAEDHNLYVTYSGGDDLFVIGNWLSVVEFARELYEKFRRATCGNDNLGLSAGIVVGRHDYPVRLAAGDAAEAQDAAKGRAGGNGDPGKRALCLFNCTHPWPRARALLQYGDEIRKLVEQERELRSLVRTVYELNRRARGELGVDVRVYPTLRAHLHYALARRAGVTAQALHQEEKREEKIRLFGRLISEPDLFEDFALVGQYVLLATREWSGRKRMEAGGGDRS